ncbi:MAG: histidine phosphatase family protein [Dehalococcoidales bacterium]|nr:histidine phosphatase family protein [Dehalococcoidales bacterium]
MTKIILARHGETAWNVEEIFRGRADVDLNATGINQAELLAEFLNKADIEAVYSGPLQRALKTAEAIAHHHNLRVEIASGLNDLDFGKWQGLPSKQVKERYPQLYDEWVNTPHRVKIPEAESLDAVRQRALSLVDEVIARHIGIVVLVSHRVVNKVLICALLGLDNSHFWNIRQDNCGITTFSHERGRFVLTGHNDTSFLAPLSQAPLSDF